MANLGQVAAIVLTDIEPTNHNILWKKPTEDIPFYYDTASGNWLPLNTAIGATITFPGTDPASVPTPPTGSATWGWNAGSFWWKDDTGTVTKLDFGNYEFSGSFLYNKDFPSTKIFIENQNIQLNNVVGTNWAQLNLGKSGEVNLQSRQAGLIHALLINAEGFKLHGLSDAQINAASRFSAITKGWTQAEILASNTLVALTDTDIALPLTEGEGLLYDTSINKWVARPIAPTDIRGLTLLLDGKEDSLGNPSANGLFLTSTTLGVRSWMPVPDSGAKVFTELTDTPADYTGQAGQAAVVKADESGLEFAPIVSTTFVKLTDTPAAYVAGKNIVVNSAGNAVVFSDNSLSNLIDTDIALPILDTEVLTWDAGISKWVARPSGSGGGATLFVGLTDTPVTYAGQKDKAVFVKTDESGLEFRESSSGGGGSASRHEFYATAGQTDFLIDEPLSDNALVSINGIDVSDTFYNDSVTNSIHFLKPLKVSDFVLVLNGSTTGGGASSFVDLTDTPALYTGQKGKAVFVKADESGLEFKTGSDTSGSASRSEFYATAGQTDFFLGEDLADNALVSINGIDVSDTFYNDSVANNIHFLKPLKVSDFVLVLNNAIAGSGGAGTGLEKVDATGTPYAGTMPINNAFFAVGDVASEFPLNTKVVLTGSPTNPDFETTTRTGGYADPTTTIPLNGAAPSTDYTHIAAIGEGWKLIDNPSTSTGIGAVNLMPTGDAPQPAMTYVGGVRYKAYTTAQIVALAGVEPGTVVYDSTKNELQYYNGTVWSDLGSPAAKRFEELAINGQTLIVLPDKVRDATTVTIKGVMLMSTKYTISDKTITLTVGLHNNDEVIVINMGV